ncbi:DEAD/DEAH box helicase [Treponema denticola]|uniref:DNA methyltransferase n=1 Tax=Treponema denticola TaxID=158 RepID=UPI004037FC44
MTYDEFLRSKIAIAQDSGFNVELSEINDILKPHQKDAVKWALHGGCRAIFASFGLGKTVIQLEILRLILQKEGGKALIVTPLNIVDEFFNDAEKLLNNLPLQYVKNQEEIDSSIASILITNYERVRDGNINLNTFTACSLDEASVLRSYGSKTYQEFLPKFKNVKYKFVATATPSPNKYKELIHYAAFLGVMDSGQSLTRFFKRDSTKANKLTIYPHKEKEFWAWVSSWGLFITKPSDVNPSYSDEGYDLPDLKIIYHKVEADHSTAGSEDDGQIKMFRDAAMGLKEAAKEKHDSIPVRVNKTLEILKNNPDEHFILWHNLEAERYALQKAVPQAGFVFGSQDIEKNVEITRQFKNGKLQYLATKPDISAQGGNMQYHCHKCIFVGIDYKFNDFIQAVHRIYRFQQNYPVEVHIIYTESEQAILKALEEKWEQHRYLVLQMTEIVKKYGLSSVNIIEKLARTIGVERKVIEGKSFKAVLNDNCIEIPTVQDNSVDLIMTSIPFSNHYEYTPTYNDFGHNEDNDKFFEQMDFLTPHLLRVLKPGRVAAIHVKDRILFGNATGYGMPTLDPFSDMTVFHFMKHGFKYMGRIVITTDVVRENNQTYRLGWTEQCKDGSKMGVGCPEYILLFRKLPTDTTRAYADIPVKKTKEEYGRGQWQIDAHAYWRSSGNRLVSLEELKECPVSDMQKLYSMYSKQNIYDYNEHIKLTEELDKARKLPASFSVISVSSNSDYVWDDINRMYTLNSEQSRKELNMHICPLQIDTVERIIERYSNKGDVIYDPFAGLFTVPYIAVKKGRYGIGHELNEISFNDGIIYLKEADIEKNAPTLFDLDDFKIAN